MACKAGQCNKTSTPYGIFIVIPSLEGWPTKAKKAPSPHEVRLAPLDTNPVFQYLGENVRGVQIKIVHILDCPHDQSRRDLRPLLIVYLYDLH